MKGEKGEQSGKERRKGREMGPKALLAVAPMFTNQCCPGSCFVAAV